jgi:hypothetical protein
MEAKPLRKEKLRRRKDEKAVDLNPGENLKTCRLMWQTTIDPSSTKASPQAESWLSLQ